MITLEEFINLCNLDGTFCSANIEERENCFHLYFLNTPNYGICFDKIEQLSNKIIINVTFNYEEKMILVELEK